MSYCSTGILLIFPVDDELSTCLIEEPYKQGLVLNDPGGRIDPADKGNPLITTEREAWEELGVRLELNEPLTCIDLHDRGRVVHKLYLAYLPECPLTPEEFQKIMQIRRELFRWSRALDSLPKYDYLKSRKLEIVSLSDLLRPSQNLKFGPRLNQLLKMTKLRTILTKIVTRNQSEIRNKIHVKKTTKTKTKTSTKIPNKILTEE